MEPPSIAVIGGHGRMGKLFARFFSDSGYTVTCFGRNDGPISWESAARRQIVLLSVPISAVEGVAGALGPFTRDDGLVVDISSLKEAPIRSMLRHCRGEVIGTHPLFGPGIESFRDQVLFLCPARSERWVGPFRSLFEKSGLIVKDIDPVEHDRLMAIVQVLRHALIFSFGKSLMKLNFDLPSELPHSGRWFTQLASMLMNQLDEKPGLYPELAFPNHAVESVMECLQETTEEITAAFRSGDREGLVRIIDEMASYFSHQR